METTSLLLSINTRWWNAEAHYAFNLGLALDQAGHQVIFLVTPDTPVAQKARDQGFRVIEDVLLDDPKPWVQWGNLKRLRRLVRDHQIDCVVSFKSAGSWVFGALRKNSPQLTHIRVRGEAREPKQNGFNRRLYGVQNCDGILCSGEQVKGWVEALGGKLPPCEVLHFGAPEFAEGGAENPLCLPKNQPIWCLLGRSQPVKGHLLCLEAFKNLGVNQVTLLFLIKQLEEFPEQLVAIKEKIIDLGLEKQVIISGPIKNLKALLSNVQLGLIPSLGSEVNCRVLVEFFSLGIPVVATPVGTLPDLIKTDQNGWLCEDLSVARLTEGMAAGLKHHQAWGVQARKDYTDHYQLQTFADRFLAFFSKIKRH